MILVSREEAINHQLLRIMLVSAVGHSLLCLSEASAGLHLCL